MVARTYEIVRRPQTLAARVDGQGQSAWREARAERALQDASRVHHGRLNREQPHTGNDRLQAGRQLRRCVESDRVLLPSSWFISPLYILCHILTFNLTNKMLMHVIKII
jgi:hypothetical protein